MILPGAGYPKELLKKSYRDWTPEEAELVRRHFLGPLLHNERYKNKPLGTIASEINRLRKMMDQDEEELRYMAMSYSSYLKTMKRSFTASPAMKTDAPPSASDPEAKES